MSYKRVLTIQDISCLGQCSLTVALPIISTCGCETCILPSAVLSTHTTGFSNFTFTDLTEDIPKIQQHWIQEKIKFDSIYTGYLGSTKQIDYVNDIFNSLGKDNCIIIVDPAMADNGKLYPAFNMEYVEAIKKLCAKADYFIPNITEACFLTNTEYKTEYNESYILNICKKLIKLGAKNIILTGVSYNENKTGIVIYSEKNMYYYEHEKKPNICYGTGDIYASAFVGALMNNKTPFDAAKIAADFTVCCIEITADDPNHWYGTKFEPVLYKLHDLIK